MSNGDVASGLSERLWIARFLVENHDRLRARLQRRLRGKLHVAVDIDDIMSSTLRRVDDLARQGRVRAVSEHSCARSSLRWRTMSPWLA